MKRVLIISPSGNYYGSEQVLDDYLKNTEHIYDVAVPDESRFRQILSESGSGHRIIPYNSTRLKAFYLKVSYLLLRSKYDVVYINEAGHSRFINLLASFFPSVKFIIHVRIVEDTNPSRWRSVSISNTVLISISDFISERLSLKSEKIYDLFDFPDFIDYQGSKIFDPVNIAIIGRITHSKGFKELYGLVQRLEAVKKLGKFHFNLYGDIIDDVKDEPGLRELKENKSVNFLGFVNNKEEIYSNNKVILHLSKTEPLGRIFFEAISFGRPLIGYNSGGIGEIGKIAGLEDYLVVPDEMEYDNLIEKLEWAVNANVDHKTRLQSAILKMKLEFGIEKYTEQLDSLLSGSNE